MKLYSGLFVAVMDEMQFGFSSHGHNISHFCHDIVYAGIEEYKKTRNYKYREM
jgi:hypothetical protein